ncbi:hypothetical protein Tco_0133924 [Tanacetum coccineum]
MLGLEVGECSLESGLEMIQETTIERLSPGGIQSSVLKLLRIEKSYADLKAKVRLEFKLGIWIMSTGWDGCLQVGTSSRTCAGVHSHYFRVYNMKKCYVDEPLAMPLEGIHVDLISFQFVEEPVTIRNRGSMIKAKPDTIGLMFVGTLGMSEFTLERESSFQKDKYPPSFNQTVLRHPLQGLKL